MDLGLVASFGGGLARRHRLPAYEASTSLYGVTRSLLIISNYVVEGRVRRKEFSSEDLQLNLVANREGSYEFVYELIFNENTAFVATALGLGVGANFIYDLTKMIVGRVSGKADEAEDQAVNALAEVRPGDIEALEDAVEPAVKAAHKIVNYGALTINIGTPPQPNKIVTLDSESKQYVWTQAINNNVRAKLFTVNSFSANSRTGRVFDLEAGRSIAFELDPDLDERSFVILLEAFEAYSRTKVLLQRGLDQAIAVQYTSVEDAGGRLKKIRIRKCRRELGDLARGR